MKSIATWAERRPPRTESDRANIAQACAAHLPKLETPYQVSDRDIEAMKAAFIKRFDEDLPRTETLFAVAAIGYRMALRDMNTEQLKQSARPDIAQALHDAAVSGQLDDLDNTARIILSDAFMSIIAWTTAHSSHKDGFWGWLRTDEGRTYMLLVAEALS